MSIIVIIIFIIAQFAYFSKKEKIRSSIFQIYVQTKRCFALLCFIGFISESPVFAATTTRTTKI